MLKLEDTEFFTQPHQMYAEGMSDAEPRVEEIKAFLLGFGYSASSVDVFRDDLQGVYRWTADIK
jgi:hypothetical protein